MGSKQSYIYEFGIKGEKGHYSGKRSDKYEIGHERDTGLPYRLMKSNVKMSRFTIYRPDSPDSVHIRNFI